MKKGGPSSKRVVYTDPHAAAQVAWYNDVLTVGENCSTSLISLGCDENAIFYLRSPRRKNAHPTAGRKDPEVIASLLTFEEGFLFQPLYHRSEFSINACSPIRLGPMEIESRNGAKRDKEKVCILWVRLEVLRLTQ